MGKYLIKRILAMIPMLLLISLLGFIALEFTPGDPLTSILSPEQASKLTEEQIEAFREANGLNGSFPERYISWLGRTLTGNFGNSLVSGAPVTKLLGVRVPATLEIVGIGLIASTLVGVALGVVAAIKQNSALDHLLTGVGVLGISVPEFFIGVIAIQFFAVKLGWLPTGGRTVENAKTTWEVVRTYIMPTAVIGFGFMANLIRYTRSSMLDVLNKDYIKTALAKGVPAGRVYFKHALRNAVQPILNLVCFRLPMLIGGAVVVEQVFIWPGMGQTILDAIATKDYPVILVCTMLTAVMVLVASFLVDIITAILDPRIRVR